MADATDVILKQMDQQWSQARQSEDHRASITRNVLVLGVAVQGFIVTLKFGLPTLGLAATLVLLGIWGAAVSSKYYERFRLHVTRVGRLMEQLEKLHPESDLTALEAEADRMHKERHPRMHHIRLHWMWSGLHAGVLGAGIIDAVVITVCHFASK